MKIEVKYFGMIAEAVNCSTEQIEVVVKKQLNLRDFFEIKYPILRAMEYKIAINQQLNDFIENGHNNIEVALLPPFAGG
jgi:molybdopterin synthase sulfur carrier subunit